MQYKGQDSSRLTYGRKPKLGKATTRRWRPSSKRIPGSSLECLSSALTEGLGSRFQGLEFRLQGLEFRL